MEFHEKGLENILKALYKQTAKDYIIAVLCNDEEAIEEITDFFKNGGYFANETGEFILAKLNREMKIAVTFVEKFLKINNKKIQVYPNEVSIWILRLIVSARYDKRVKVYTDDEKRLFLIKKKAVT